MDEKRYCVHAALGTRGERLRLVRVRPEHCECTGQDAAGQPHDHAASVNTVGFPFAEVIAPDNGRLLPMPGARPVVLAEGLTSRQAQRLAALLSGLVDADVPQAAGTTDAHAGPGNGEAPCIVPAQAGGRGIAVPEGTQHKARTGLNLLREALLGVMACNPKGLTGPDLLLALGLAGEPVELGEPETSEMPGVKDERSRGADLLVRALLELLREAGAVRPTNGNA